MALDLSFVEAGVGVISVSEGYLMFMEGAKVGRELGTWHAWQ